MARSLQLLLTENVDNLGNVGDVLNDRLGYARNYLLPRSLATKPSEEAIKALASKRAEAEKLIAEQRALRAQLAKKLDGIEISLIRACNDMGILYGAVTQQEISKALLDKGYDVRPRDVRLPHAIKRVEKYEVHIKFEADLEATINLNVLPDRPLDLDERRDEAPKGAVSENAPAEGEAAAGEKPRKSKEATDSATATEPGEKKAKKAKKE
jgi:large subunit ribosomal protein L9